MNFSFDVAKTTTHKILVSISSYSWPTVNIY